MKTMDVEAILENENSKERHSTECCIHGLVTVHPFLVGMHYHFCTESKVILVLDYYASGDLLHYLHEKNCLTEEARLLLAEVALGVQHLHELGVVHRDLKPDNILLSADGHVAITFFGLSKKFTSNCEEPSANSCVGTPVYIAPEVLKRTGHGPEVD